MSADPLESASQSMAGRGLSNRAVGDALQRGQRRSVGDGRGAVPRQGNRRAIADATIAGAFATELDTAGRLLFLQLLDVGPAHQPRRTWRIPPSSVSSRGLPPRPAIGSGRPASRLAAAATTGVDGQGTLAAGCYRSGAPSSTSLLACPQKWSSRARWTRQWPMRSR